jgi:hypothetical protein
MHSRIVIGLVALGAVGAASGTRADPATESRSPQVQLDLGLAVIAAGYEHPIGRRLAIQGEAFIFGTYFLPWFDAGDDVVGAGAGVRATWFRSPGARGLYVAPFVRVARVSGELESGEASGAGAAISGGAFAGWAFRLTRKLDLRIGGGVQYMHFDAGALSASTPFVALDAVVGYRL